MNCREYQDRWNELLDARSDLPADLERGLEAHASTCLRCGSLARGYQALRQGVAILRPPVASAESIERLSQLTVPSIPLPIPIGPSRPRHRSGLRRLAPLAVASAAFVLAWLGTGWWPSRAPVDRPASAPSSTVSDRALGLALVEATEATLVLARETSAPASRIGREMIDLGRMSTEGLDPSPDPAAQPAPSVDPESESSPSDLFRTVGERVGAGVRPLSGSARHAFGFLLGPSGAGAPVQALPPKRDSL